MIAEGVLDAFVVEWAGRTEGQNAWQRIDMILQLLQQLRTACQIKPDSSVTTIYDSYTQHLKRNACFQGNAAV